MVSWQVDCGGSHAASVSVFFFFLLLTTNKAGVACVSEKKRLLKKIGADILLVSTRDLLRNQGRCGLASLFFGPPLDSLHPLSGIQTAVRLSAYQGHLPVSCQHVCLLIRLSLCQTHPRCYPAKSSASKKHTKKIIQQTHFLSYSLAHFNPRPLFCCRVSAQLNWDVVYQSNCSPFSTLQSLSDP